MSPMVGRDALTDMIDAHVRATERCAGRIADAGFERFERNVYRRTPVDTNPFRHRPGRPRGTLRRSLRRGHLERDGDVYTGLLIFDDPVARLVEFDTPPHVIRPNTPGGRLVFQSRDGWVDDDGIFHPPGTWVSVEEVHHPGTKGQHMMSLGALETEREIDEWARDPLARWKREVESVHVRARA